MASSNSAAPVTVFEEGNFRLLRSGYRAQSISKHDGPAEFYRFRLHDRVSGMMLLGVDLQRPHAQNGKTYVIFKVKSAERGNLMLFPQLMGMMRKNLRAKRPGADIVSFNPIERMENYYKRLGARWRKTGYMHFPQNLARGRAHRK